MSATKKPPIEVGTGILDWPRAERVSDRYGSVYLFAGLQANAKPVPLTFPPFGQKGKLYATVIRANRSRHCGDLFRGIKPSMTKSGTRLLVGAGRAKEDYEGAEPPHFAAPFLVQPIRPRASDWLDPHILYRLHDHLVRLVWEPD